MTDRTGRPRAALLIAAAALLAAAPAAAAEDTLSSTLPRDAVLVLMFHDVETIEQRWDASAVGRAAADPAFAGLIDPFAEMFRMLDGEGSRGAEDGEDAQPGALDRIVEEAIGGDLAMVVADLDAFENEDPVGGTLLVAGIRDEDVLREILADAPMFPDDLDDVDPERVDLRDEDFLGARLRISERHDEDGVVVERRAVAIHDGHLVAGGEDAVRDQIARMVQGAEDSFDDRRELVALRRQAPAADVVLVLGLDAIMDAVMEEAKVAAEANGGGPEDAPAGPFGPTDPETMFRAMGFDAVGGLTLALTLGVSETDVDAVLTYEEERGLWSVLAAYRPGPVELPSFIPQSAFEATAANFSVPMMWAGLRDMLIAMQPEMGGMIDMQLGQLKEATGIDLEKNVIGSMGETLFLARFMPESDTPGEAAVLDPDNIPQVIGVEIVDTQSFDQGLQLLVAMLEQAGPGFRRVEYLDAVFYELALPGMVAPPDPDADPGDAADAPEPTTMAFAHAGGHLLLSTGGTDPLRAILAQMAEPSTSVWEQDRVRDALARLPADASGVSVSSTFQLGTVLLEAFLEGFREGLADPGDGGPEGRKEPTIPPSEVFRKYFETMVAGVYRADGELRLTWKLTSGR